MSRACFAMKTKCAAPITKMLTPERSQIKPVRVVTNGLRSINHSISILRPAVAQFAILRRPELLIESRKLTKGRRRHRQVIGSEKQRLAAHVEMAVNRINH